MVFFFSKIKTIYSYYSILLIFFKKYNFELLYNKKCRYRMKNICRV